MASKASIADQQSQLQENVHAQIKSFSLTMDEILIRDTKRIVDAHELPQQPIVAPCWSGLGFAVRRNGQPTDHPVVPETKPLNRAELSERLQDLNCYKLDIKPSQMPHKEARCQPRIIFRW